MATKGYFCVERNDQFRECFLLDRPTVTLGSAPKSLVTIDDPHVASVHAEICKTADDAFSIKDLSGRGDVFVNDVQSSTHSLAHGDLVRIAQWNARFELVEIAPQEAVLETHCELLLKLSRLNSQVAEINSLLHESLKQIHSSLQLDCSCIFLFDELTEEFNIISSISRLGLALESPRGAHNLPSKVVVAREPVRLESSCNDGSLQAIGVPMICFGKMVGGICVEVVEDDHESPTNLDPQTVDLLMAAASQLAIAIENQSKRDLLDKNQPLYAVGNALTSLEHQIMNIWQSFHGGIFILQDGLTNSKPNLARQGWEMIHRDQNRLFELIQDVLSFNTKHEFQLRSEDLRQVINSVVNEVRTCGEFNATSIQWTAPENIDNAVIDSELITKVIRNLIHNAMEACRDTEQPEIIVQLKHLADQQVFKIAVSDNGCGIAEERVPLLKLPFETTKVGRKTGIGLAFAQKCVEKHEGELRVESQVGKGSTFTLVLPDKNRLSNATLEYGRAPKDQKP